MTKYLYSMVDFGNGLHTTIRYASTPQPLKEDFFFPSGWMCEGDAVEIEAFAIYKDTQVMCFHVRRVYKHDDVTLYNHNQLCEIAGKNGLSTTPLHITLWTDEDVKPVQSGRRLRRFLNSYSYPNSSYTLLEKPISFLGRVKLVEAEEEEVVEI
tara:strand:- start:2295 stop:2756 length:462 start_codon:yes stop_codon:yes gene_type:complete